jgi:CRISPR system Cascade subunit CasC
MRNEFDAVGLIERDFLARRTKRLVAELADRLQSGGRDVEEAKSVIKLVLGGVELEVGSDDRTQYLLFLGSREIDKLADICTKHWALR